MQRNTSRFSDHASGQRCARIGEARDLLPYAHCGDVEIDDVTLTLRIPDHPRPSQTIPDGRADRILAHITQFNS